MVDHIENQDSATSVATAAGSDVDAILLHTPMYLTPEAGTVWRVSSPTPFLINGVKVRSSAPIFVYNHTGGRFVDIKPTNSLGPEFERGWHKLPDELKALRLTKILRVRIARQASSKHARDFKFITRDYWTKNTFLLECTITPRLGQRAPPQPHPPQSRFLADPNLGVNGMVKRVEFHCSANPTELTHLLRFANGDYAFQDLRYVKVVIQIRHVSDRWEAALRAALATGVRFACEGDLRVKLEREEDEHRKQLQKSLKELLFSSFSFGCSKTKHGVIADSIEG